MLLDVPFRIVGKSLSVLVNFQSHLRAIHLIETYGLYEQVSFKLEKMNTYYCKRNPGGRKEWVFWGYSKGTVEKNCK